MELLSAACEIPTDGVDGRCLDCGTAVRGSCRNEFESDVLFFHEANRGSELKIAGEEDWLRIAVAQRLQFAQPACEDRRDAIEGKLGMDAEKLFGLAACKLLRGEGVEAVFHFMQICRGHGKADGEGVPSETGVEAGAGFNSFEQRKA